MNIQSIESVCDARFKEEIRVLSEPVNYDKSSFEIWVINWGISHSSVEKEVFGVGLPLWDPASSDDDTPYFELPFLQLLNHLELSLIVINLE